MIAPPLLRFLAVRGAFVVVVVVVTLQVHKYLWGWITWGFLTTGWFLVELVGRTTFTFPTTRILVSLWGGGDDQSVSQQAFLRRRRREEGSQTTARTIFVSNGNKSSPWSWSGWVMGGCGHGWVMITWNDWWMLILAYVNVDRDLVCKCGLKNL